jgi:branched-chain amino acid transport system permease protein
MTQATTAVIYGIIASGLGLVYGRLGMLSMSHALLWGVGSYTGAILITNYGWSFWTALPASIITAAVAGGITSLPAIRLRGHHFLIGGFILTEIAVVVETQMSITGGATGVLVAGLPSPILGVNIGTVRGYYYLCVVLLIVALLLLSVIYRRPIGRRFVAIRENSRLAETLGINLKKELLVGFTLSGLFAGLGGCLYAVNLGQIEPDSFSLNAAVLLPLVVMIGGAGYIWGPVVGAFIVVFLPQLLHLSPTAAEGTNGGLLIVLILFMPDGVLSGFSRLSGLWGRRPGIGGNAMSGDDSAREPNDHGHSREAAAATRQGGPT